MFKFFQFVIDVSRMFNRTLIIDDTDATVQSKNFLVARLKGRLLGPLAFSIFLKTVNCDFD